MDPKNTASLDPKLKEVYDRVMGTNTGGTKPASPSLGGPTTPPPTSLPASPVQPDLGGLPPLPSTPPPSQPGLTPPPPPPPASPLPEIPKTNGAALSAPPPPQVAPTSTMKPTVDYAALAAKYATPLPTIDPNTPIAKAPAVTPSTTAYGVVNNGDTKAKPAQTGEKKPGGKKKLLLIVGIPIGILVYTVIWIVVFQVDVMSLLPLPK